MNQALEIVDQECFYKSTHKKIFSCIANLFNKNRAVDLITLTEELKKTGELDEIGGVSYLTMLANAVPTAANVGHYARIVKEKSILRGLINHATQIVTAAYEPEVNVDEVLDRAESLIFEISD